MNVFKLLKWLVLDQFTFYGSSGSSGGSTTTTTELPSYAQPTAQNILSTGQSLSRCLST